MSGKAQASTSTLASSQSEDAPVKDVETESRSNAAVAADLEKEQDSEDEPSWWESTLSAVGLGDDTTDPADNMAAKIEALQSASEDQQIDALVEWLSDGWFDTVTAEETEAAKSLLAAMTPEGRQRFAEIDGGALADQLIDSPEGTPWWADPLGALVEDFSGTMQAVKEDASAAWDAGAAVVGAVRDGEEAGLNLDLVQAAKGGDLGGVKLDTSEDHMLEVDGDLDEGQLTIGLPNLAIKSINATVGPATVTTESGVVAGLEVTVDVPDQDSAETSLSMHIDSIDFNALGLEISDPFLQVLLPRLVILALDLYVARAEIDKSELTEGAGAETALTDLVGEQLTFFGMDLLTPFVEAAQAVDDATALARGLAEAANSGALNVDASFDKLEIPEQAQIQSLDAEGNLTHTTLDSLTIESFEMTVQSVDRISMLEQELAGLKNRPNMVDAQRINHLEVEIPRLQGLAKRKASLDTKKQAGTLSTDENEEWITLDRALTAGVVQISIGSVDISGINHGGEKVDSLRMETIDAKIGGMDLDVDAQADTGKSDRLKNLEAAVGITQKPGEAKKSGDIGDLSINASIGSTMVKGVDTEGGDVDRVSAGPTSFTAAGDLMEVQSGKVEASGIDAAGASVDSASVNGLDMVVRGGGTDVGGTIGSVSASGVAYEDGETKASVDNASVNGIGFDANVGSGALRSGSVKGVSADGVHYEDGANTVDVKTAGVNDVRATGASADGAKSVSVGEVAASGVDFSGGGTSAHVDSAGVTGVDLTGVTTSGASSAAVEGIDAHGVSYNTDDMAVSVDHAAVTNVGATGVTTGGASDVNVGKVGVDGVDYKAGTTSASVGMASISDISASGVTTSGALTAGVGEINASTVAYKDADQSVNVGGAQVTGVSASDVSAKGTGSAVVDGMRVEDASYSGTVGSGSIDSAEVEGLAATRDAQGTVATVDGARLEGINGSSGDMKAGVDTVEVGRSGVALDAENNLEGASVNGLNIDGVHVELLKLPLNEVTPATAPAPASGSSFEANPLATASGQFAATIPVKNGGFFSVSARADHGMVPLADIDIDFDGGVLGNIAAWAADGAVRVKDGKGLIAGFGPFNLAVLMDPGEGLISKKQGSTLR